MDARAAISCALALCALVCDACAQESEIYVEVTPHNHSSFEEVEQRKLTELARDLDSTKHEVLLLYTEYSAKAGSDMKVFLKNISRYAVEAIEAAGKRPVNNDDESSLCLEAFEDTLKKIELNAYRAASFSSENHHKFLLGHMIVFRMHINKSEEYIRKCDRALYGCGAPCESKPRVKRWKRLAAEELHRVKEDILHSRKSYRDLVAHAKRRLNHLRKQIDTKTAEALREYHNCLDANKGLDNRLD